MEPNEIKEVENQIEAIAAEEAAQIEETLIHEDPTISEQTAD